MIDIRIVGAAAFLIYQTLYFGHWLAIVGNLKLQLRRLIERSGNLNRIANWTATDCPRDKVENDLSKFSLVGNNRRDLRRKFVFNLHFALLRHARCRSARLTK